MKTARTNSVVDKELQCAHVLHENSDANGRYARWPAIAPPPPLFSSAGARHQRSFNGGLFVLSESAPVLHVCSIVRPVVIMATLSLAARGLECCKSPFFWRIIVLDEFEANACMRAQVLNSRFWCSSDAATSNRRQQHHSCCVWIVSGFSLQPTLLQAKNNSSQEQQDSCMLRLTKTIKGCRSMLYQCIYLS